MAALAESRLLVPIVAAPTEVDESGTLAVEKSTDMAVVTLTAPDGTKGLPVFSSLDDLARWDPKARPSPVRAAFAAQAAISEQCEVLLLDMASSHRVVVRASIFDLKRSEFRTSRRVSRGFLTGKAHRLGPSAPNRYRPFHYQELKVLNLPR